eukprot:1293848-Lingulodinium_polyedra.AAC.1
MVGPTVLPDCCKEGLRSAAQQGRLEVLLLSYQQVDAPPGVTLRSCGDIMPEPQFHSYLDMGFTVTFLSDYLRAKALQGGGWFIDCDTLWVKAPGTCFAPR